MEKTFEQGHFRNQASTWWLSRALISIMLPPLGFTHPHFDIALTFGLYPPSFRYCPHLWALPTLISILPSPLGFTRHIKNFLKI